MAGVVVYTDTRDVYNKINKLTRITLKSLEGIEAGKAQYLKILGPKIAEVFGTYIDLTARAEPDRLHHVYEWYETGKTDARLFQIIPVYRSGGITFRSIFLESQTIQHERETEVEFWNKASVMERGLTLKIEPKNGKALKYFDEDLGDYVFSKQSIVTKPGGEEVKGAFGVHFNTFFTKYLSQTKILTAGMLIRPFSKAYSKTLKAAMRTKGATNADEMGFETGYRWMVGAADVVEFE